MAKKKDDNSAKHIAFGALGGAVAGAAAGAAAAHFSEEEHREEAARKIKEIAVAARDKMSEANESIEEKAPTFASQIKRKSKTKPRRRSEK